MRFFLLVFALSLPLMLLGTVFGFELLPGLPLWIVIAAFSPFAAAAILSYRERGSTGVTELLARSVDFRRTTRPIWYLPILLLMPLVALVTRGTLASMKVSLPPIHLSAMASGAGLLVWLVLAQGEELGWSGYAIDPLQARWTGLGGGLILGGVWALWHVPAMVQLGMSATLIGWGCLDMVATRVICTWLYNNTGRSVFAIALYHAVANLTVKTVFPGGSDQAERMISLVLTGIAATVTIASGPELGRLRPAAAR